MIDPQEAAIQFLLGREELAGLGGRIASKHKYGEDWTTEQASLIVMLDDSNPSWYVQMHDIRLEIWSLAADDGTAMDNWMLLLGISRVCNRDAVLTSKGDALVYAFLPESGPSYLPDEELTQMKRVLSFWRIQVGEEVISEQ